MEDLTKRLEEEGVTCDVNEENVEREESIALVANKDNVILIAKFRDQWTLYFRKACKKT